MRLAANACLPWFSMCAVLETAVSCLDVLAPFPVLLMIKLSLRSPRVLSAGDDSKGAMVEEDAWA